MSQAMQMGLQLRPWAGLLACLGLVQAGVLPTATLFAVLASDLLLLLLATFLLAVVLQDSGLTERLALRVLAGAGSMASLCWRLSFLIAATAFVIPSTSARAALLMPVFAGLARTLAGRRQIRALALLFPTIILLSAGASLTGAGANIAAAEVMGSLSGEAMTFGGWARLAAPFALATCVTATWLILHLFLGPDERRAGWTLRSTDQPAVTGRQRAIGVIVVVTVAGWFIAAAAGWPLAGVAIAGALAATCPAITGHSLPRALGRVDWPLLGALASVMLVAHALVEWTQSSGWLDGVARGLRGAGIGPVAAILIACTAAVLSHLLVVSRTARAMVLIPTVALPLATSGADAALLVFVCVQGSGFCQSVAASAKPVAIFARPSNAGERPPFVQADLWRLAVPLATFMLVLLAGFALCVWPQQGV